MGAGNFDPRRRPLDKPRMGAELQRHDLVLIPVEEFLWSKLYIVYRDRCDWPDTAIFPSGRAPSMCQAP